MSEDLVALPRCRWSRLPAAPQARLQELIGGRPMVPDGDRRHRPQSGRVVDDVNPVLPRDDHIVRELVLHDDIDGQPKADDILERAMGADDRGQLGDLDHLPRIP